MIHVVLGISIAKPTSNGIFGHCTDGIYSVLLSDMLEVASMWSNFNHEIDTKTINCGNGVPGTAWNTVTT